MPPKQRKTSKKDNITFQDEVVNELLETQDTTCMENGFPSSNFLVIVESPSKCSKIESFLGPKCKCIASKGHLRTIEGLKSIKSKEDYEVEFTIMPEKTKHVALMRSIIKEYSPQNIYLASDDDREGESIAWHICQIFGLSVETTKRIVFHEITQTAVAKALLSPTKINMALVKAQHARQVLDILVGFKVSPYLWKFISFSRKNSLSAGRCQTPALMLVYENEKEKLSAAVDAKYKTIGYFTDKNIEFTLNNEWKTEDEVRSFLEVSKNWTYEFTIHCKKESCKQPPKPYNTSRLLQEASYKVGLSPKKTMSGLQMLYQDGHITYMRTENAKYSEEFTNKAKEYIVQKWSTNHVGDLEKVTNRDANNPHEGVRVTHLERRTVYYEKDPKVASLYKMIWNNSIQSCMSEAKYNVTKVSINAPLETQYISNFEIPMFLGWKAVTTSNDEEDPSITNPINKMSDETALFMLSNIRKTTSHILCNQVVSNQTLTKHHSHYTEASLIQKLEDLGIGRPSTFSTIVDTIREREYVKKMNVEGINMECTDFELLNGKISETKKSRVFGAEKNKLVIQPYGIIVIEFLNKHFGPLFEYGFTRTMEEQLDTVCEQDVQWHDICRGCDNQIKGLAKQIGPVSKSEFPIDESNTLIFMGGKALVRHDNENGEQELKPVKSTLVIDIDRLKNGEYHLEDLLEIKNDVLGQFNGNDVKLKVGKFGAYAKVGDKNYSLKGLNIPLNEMTLEDVIPYIDPTASAIAALSSESTETTYLRKPSQMRSVLRTLTTDLSIRKGKFGAYLFHQTATMKTPQFLSLAKFKKPYLVCDVGEILDWAKTTYNIDV